MNFDNYTERSQGFIQSAQSLALRSGHQRLTPEHLLKVLLDDKEGLAANLIRAAGGDPERALADRGRARQAAEGRRRRRRPGLSGARNGAPLRPGRETRGEGRRQLRHRRAAAAGAGLGERHARGRASSRMPASRRRALNARDQRSAQGPHGRQRLRRGGLRRAEEIRPRPDRRRRATASSTR